MAIRRRASRATPARAAPARSSGPPRAMALRHNASSLRFLQGLVQIPKYIVLRLEPDGEPDHFRCHAGGELFVFGQLAVGGRRRMDDERLRIADVREVRKELDRIDEAHARGGAAADAEGQDSARAVRQVAAGEFL